MIELSVQIFHISHFAKISIVRESSISHKLAPIVSHLLLQEFLLIRHVVGDWLAAENETVLGAMTSTRVLVGVVLDTRWPGELHWVDRTDIWVCYWSASESPLRVASPRCAHDVVVELLLAFVCRSVRVIQTAELRLESRFEKFGSVNFFEVSISVV